MQGLKEKKLTKKDLNNLKKAQENIESHKQLPKEVSNSINKRIFHNIIVAIGIVTYLFFINLASVNIKDDVLVTDLKVFSVIAIMITIVIFEYSYKKDNGIMCIFGIESLIIAIATLFLSYLCAIHHALFQLIVAWTSLGVAIYYIAKSIVIYLKMKKEYYKSINDINDIVKKEK